MPRPEYTAPPELYYNEDEAQKYTQNSRIIEIQTKMTHRALELLNLPDYPCYILDLGCGSGLSGSVLEDEGHYWVGLDISRPMLNVARERELESGDVIEADLGQGLQFRAGTFDGAISISALQWLCNADKKCHKPQRRLFVFFQSLYSMLSRGSRAVFQFYPQNSQQSELIVQQAMRAGFTGGLVVDYPNSTKAKKIFLVLNVGGNMPIPQGLKDDNHVPQKTFKDLKGRSVKSRSSWIQEKKEKRRRQGKDVCHDSKYSGRKRTGKFF